MHGSLAKILEGIETKWSVLNLDQICMLRSQKEGNYKE